MDKHEAEDREFHMLATKTLENLTEITTGAKASFRAMIIAVPVAASAMGGLVVYIHRADRADISSNTAKPISHITRVSLADTDPSWDWRVGTSLTADHKAAADALVAQYQANGLRPVSEWAN
jgi:hypothetical protein